MPLNIDLQQIFLHLLNFTLLFAILYFLLYKPVKDFMAKREAYYEDMDAEAKASLAKAKADETAYDNLMKDAKNEILEKKEKARRDAEEYYNNKMRQAQDDAAEIITAARQEAQKEKEKILGSLQAEITEMITEATEKIILKDSASDAFNQFLDAAEGGESDVRNLD